MFPHTEITTLMAEAVPIEEKASVEEEVPEGLGSTTGGTSVEATTPLKKGASPIGGQPEGTPFSTPLPVISLDDQFTSLPYAVGGGPSLVVTLSSIPSFATKMLDIEMLPNEASDDVLEDSDDEPIVKTRVSDSEDLSIEEIDAIVVGIDLLSLNLLVFLSCFAPF